MGNSLPIPVEKLSGLKTRKSINELLGQVKRIERVDKALIVLLDSSGSMHDKMDEVNSKIDVAWNILRNELAPNMNGWTYGILTFQGWRETTWTIYPSRDTQALVSMKTPQAYGSTPMKAALEMAWHWVRENAKQARFILLSDGVPTDSLPMNILAVTTENNSIPIDTVGIGTGRAFSAYNKEFLIKLSEITGGQFCEANSVKKLANMILELSPSNRPLLGTIKGEQSAVS